MIDSSQLKAILQAEKSDALSAMSASKLSDDRSKAMDYYMGDMSADMPAMIGRSSAVSSDVADTVDSLMPAMMEIFASSDQVVQFDPVSKEDIEAAQQETDYINHVFMQNNPGFMVLFSFIKDALLSKVGVVKVWWEEEDEDVKETYYDLTDEQLAMIVSSDDAEIVNHTVKDRPGEPDEKGADVDD
jgi:hypothetical protein